MHASLQPLALILCPIGVLVDTLACHEIARPAPLVHITVRIGELTLLTSFVTVPEAFILGAIFPDHGSASVA